MSSEQEEREYCERVVLGATHATTHELVGIFMHERAAAVRAERERILKGLLAAGEYGLAVRGVDIIRLINGGGAP